MTSVIDNPGKVSEYILYLPSDGHLRFCRRISTRGEAGFSVSEGSIRYGLSAIKSVGRSGHRGHGKGTEAKTGSSRS